MSAKKLLARNLDNAKVKEQVRQPILTEPYSVK